MPYSQLFSAFASHLEAILTQGGYAVLFFTTALEGLPLVGMAIPGHVSIIVAGFLSKVGVLNLYGAVLLAVAGAIIGDFMGYWFGRRYGLSFIDRLRPYFSIRDSHLQKASDLLARHTGKAMIIGRFSPVTRALMPFLVGAHHVPSGRFWFFNIVGALSWVAVSMGVGYAFGAGYHAASGYIGRVAMAAVIIALLIVWGYRFINMRFHVFARYELFALALNLVSIAALAWTFSDAWSAPSFLAGFDISVNLFVADQVTPLMQRVAWWVTTLGGTEVMAILGAIFGAGLAFNRKWRSSAIMLLSVGSTGIALGVLKQFFLRVRPENAIEAVINDPSFPSGHAGMAASFFVIAAYLMFFRIKSWVRRELFLVFCTAAIAAIGLSRIALNVHWASDVIAGWALGAFLATGSILLVRYMSELVVKKDIR